jgi:starch phosphorylase
MPAGTRLESVLDRFRSVTSGEDFQLSFLHHLLYTCGKDFASATREDKYTCLSLAVRDRVMEHMIATQQAYLDQDVKRVYYFSMEYLIGRMLSKNIMTLGMFDLIRDALAGIGCDLDDLVDVERDAALGNGGLGRLAACYMDSLATLGYPAYGYGIFYEYGLFRQELQNGHQRERPDPWLEYGSPWHVARAENNVPVPLYGWVESSQDLQGNYNPMWLGWRVLLGEPHDIPMVGFGGRTVNLLRLFRARSSNEFDMRIFNSGDFVKAVREKVLSETVSKVLYPVDAIARGRELRLVQEYFLVRCGISDIVRRYRKRHTTWDEFPDHIAIQMNDTHPSLVVAELQRFFVDDAGLDWDLAWSLVRRTLGFTNHTLMPEALEKWAVPLLEKVIPRHLEVIYEINHRFLEGVRQSFPGDPALVERVSLIEEGGVKQVRMANLAVVGSHSVNGVAEIHSRLLREHLFADFYRMWPERFRNVTNGITPRRWLLTANRALSELIHDRIGRDWITDLERLRELLNWADDPEFLADLSRVKRANKERLRRFVQKDAGIDLPVDMLYDVQAKRLHEYKRQLLNALNIVDRYLRLKADPSQDMTPTLCLFAAKAAPGYQTAKLIIKLISNIAEVVNADPQTRDLLQVRFLPDYRVSLAEALIPASDLSEQISLAGMEASGTGNMKFALNGALTLGTLDGANIEIRDAVGPENIFIFGMTVEEVQQRRDAGYNSRAELEANPELKRVLNAISENVFSPHEKGIFEPLVRSLTAGGDPYMLVADYRSYAERRAEALDLYRNEGEWWRRVVHNVARVGRFSSDRSIREYAEEIWGLQPVRVPERLARL